MPKFGTNLLKYLFAPVTKGIADQIGNEIIYAIERWEPRVTVNKIVVIGHSDAHEYDVEIDITINAINKTVVLNTILNEATNISIKNLNRVCPS